MRGGRCLHTGGLPYEASAFFVAFLRNPGKNRKTTLICSPPLFSLCTKSPSSALLPLFLGEGSPSKIDYGKKGYPYSNPSTGGPSLGTERTAGRPAELDGGGVGAFGLRAEPFLVCPENGIHPTPDTRFF